MMEQQEKSPLPQAPVNELDLLGHRILGGQVHHEEKSRSFSKPLRKHFIGTLNVNTLVKTGKLKQLTNTLEKFRIKIMALQETRFTDENHFTSENYKIYKGKPAIKHTNSPTMFGTAFAIHKSVEGNITDFTSTSERISTVSFRSGNKTYTIINVHAPTNDWNRKNPQGVESFWEDVEETANKIPEKHVKILLGDFNAQLGQEKKFRGITGLHTAHKRTNKNGEHFIEFCRIFDFKIMSTRFKKPRRKLTTWKSPSNHTGEYQIDHVAISGKNTQEILNVRTRKGFFESDHHVLQVKIRPIPQNRKQETIKIPRPDPEYIKQNREKIIEEIKQENTGRWENLMKITQNAMKIAVPPRIRKHRWWNIACDQALDRRIQAWKNYNSQRTLKKWQEFHTIQKQTSKEIRQEKRSYDKRRLDEIEEDFKKNNTRNFYRTFRENIRGYQPQSTCFKRPDGSLETNAKANCKILAQYFNALLNCEEPTERLVHEAAEQNPDSIPPTFTEIRDIIKELKNNKAPGEDGIIAEIWKLNDREIMEKIHMIITRIWDTEIIPQDWKCAMIHPLHKKGDKTDPNNYRGISLLPITYKILSKALLYRLEKQVDHQIGEYQAGFRRGRSCAEQIWNLRTILRMRNTRNTVITFVDFKKAYDSIDRQTLFNTLKEYGVDGKTLRLIQQTLTETTAKVKFMGEISEPFNIKTGVRQGDGLSPLLFNIVLDKIVREWEEYVKGIQLGKKREVRTWIKCLAFADDLAILNNNREEAQEAIEKLHEIATKTGLQISYEKTQYMEKQMNGTANIKTKYGIIDRTKTFKYLGEIIQVNGANKEANAERTTKLKKAYKLTWAHYNKKNISIHAKLRHYDTVVLPEALYAAETTTIKASNIKETEKIERQILRKIYGAVNRENIWMKRPTEELYKDREKLTEVIRKRRVQFYGHILRMKNTRLTKKIFNIAKVSTKLIWFQEVENDLKELGINIIDVQNRERFRNLVRKMKLKEQKKTGKKWTEQRKEEHSNVMKNIWESKKKVKPGKTAKTKREYTWNEERKQKHREIMKRFWEERKRTQNHEKI